MKKKYNIGDRAIYGSIAYDIKCKIDDANILALAMMIESKSYASTYGIVFEDGSEIYLYKTSLSKEDIILIKNKMN